MHGATVPNVNTIPGEDMFCFDCRVLPDYDLDDLLNYAQAQCRYVDARTGTTTRMTVRSRHDAPPATRPDAPVVKMLEPAIREVYGVEPVTMGIGGMTVASPFRTAGFQAAVWMTTSGTEHQVNEVCSIPHMVGDARVFARAMATEF
jgi:succinyl-diaminopimelate desuccinylase